MLALRFEILNITFYDARRANSFYVTRYVISTIITITGHCIWAPLPSWASLIVRSASSGLTEGLTFRDDQFNGQEIHVVPCNVHFRQYNNGVYESSGLVRPGS